MTEAGPALTIGRIVHYTFRADTDEYIEYPAIVVRVIEPPTDEFRGKISLQAFPDAFGNIWSRNVPHRADKPDAIESWHWPQDCDG